MVAATLKQHFVHLVRVSGSLPRVSSQTWGEHSHGSCCIKGEKEQEAANRCGQVTVTLLGKHLCKQMWPGDGCPMEKHLCSVRVKSLGGSSSGTSPSHFPVSHHARSEKRACNYPVSTWVPDSELISEPTRHLTRPAPSPALWVIHPAALQQAQPLFGFIFVLPL